MVQMNAGCKRCKHQQPLASAIRIRGPGALISAAAVDITDNNHRDHHGHTYEFELRPPAIA
jgi:hypothetical protein